MRTANTARAEMPQPEEAAAPSEHRRDQRYIVDLDVSLGSDHNFYSGFAENLSAGGVFVATHLIRPAGEALEIRLHLPDGTEIHVAGEVRWTRVFNPESDTPPGMGVRFGKLDPASNAAIERFLRDREPLFFDDE